jgi:hypothetical protein
MDYSRIFIYIFLVVLINGCQTYRKVENLKPKSGSPNQDGFVAPEEFKKLRNGDRIMVWAGGRSYYLGFGIVREGQLRGNLWRDPFTGKNLSRKKQYEMTIPINEVTELRVKKVNWGLTAGVYGGSLVFTYVLIMTSDYGFSLYD